MNEEEKFLLIQDLCEKFPYGLKCKSDVKSPIIAYCTLEKICKDVNGGFYIELKDRDFDGNALASTSVNDFSLIKPYLRPMSSMTPEEVQEFNKFYSNWDINKPYTEILVGKDVSWLNSHYLDYRRLIEKNLAVEAPENMYNLNK